jgi:hypothetical protein
MKRLWTLLGGVGLIVASGAIASADEDTRRLRTTLFTPRLHGDHFNCQVVNVSKKILGIEIAVLNADNGELLVPALGGDTNPTQDSVHPGTALGADFLLPMDQDGLQTVGDGYCEVTVSGSANRDDVRVGLGITLTRTIPGTSPPVPVFLFRDVEGH